MEEKKCFICGKPFIPRKSSQQCCSTECAKKKSSITQRKMMTCVYCGSQFWKPADHTIKYCSKECRHNDYFAKHPREDKNKIVYSRKCEWCNKEFQTNNPNKKYCCESCCYEGGKKLKRDQWKQGFISKKIVCKECGIEFETECGKPRSVFCCQTCADRYEGKRELKTTYVQEERKRHKKKREQLIKSLFIEDVSFDEVYQKGKGICQICGMPVDLNAEVNTSWDGTIDHIIPLSLGGLHCLSNCQLSHRICNSLKKREGDSFHIDWNEKSKENNYWKKKLSDYLLLNPS